MKTRFSNSQFALLTRHEKEQILAPLLATQLDATLVLTQDFDTDALGTFSGEIERKLNPKECALKKAQLACELTGLNLGLGSEGSFTPSPYGFGIANHELIACVDIQSGWSLIGHHYSFSSSRAQVIHNTQELFKFVASTPANQGLMLRSPAGIAKGLYGLNEIEEHLTHWFGSYGLLGSAFEQELVISDDLRAHHCPERRGNIRKAMENLIARLLSPCPRCNTPGFWPDQAHSGLPCRDCGSPTHGIKARRAQCANCHLEQSFPTAEAAAAPSHCPVCNP